MKFHLLLATFWIHLSLQVMCIRNCLCIQQFQMSLIRASQRLQTRALYDALFGRVGSQKNRTYPHIVSKLLLEGAEDQESRCLFSFRRMNAHNLFTFYLQSGKQLRPLVLFKCFSTPENADAVADHTAVAELVIRNMFWSKQPLGLSAGSRSAAFSVATLRCCWLHPLQLTRNYICVVLDRLQHHVLLR